MFTGIVIERGRVVADPRDSGRGGVELVLAHSGALADRLEIGASVAVSGVCLTVTHLLRDDSTGVARSTVELSPETLARTHLDRLRQGSQVNLEPALRAADPLGGHLVQGHVDGTLELLHRQDLTDHSVFTFELPAEFARYVVEKGSIALDGVSLTVARLLDDRFTVALIPHTLTVTTLGGKCPGDPVNFEVDVLAKHVERLLAGHLGRSEGGGGEAPPWERLASEPGGDAGGSDREGTG